MNGKRGSMFECKWHPKHHFPLLPNAPPSSDAPSVHAVHLIPDLMLALSADHRVCATAAAAAACAVGCGHPDAETGIRREQRAGKVRGGAAPQDPGRLQGVGRLPRQEGQRGLVRQLDIYFPVVVVVVLPGSVSCGTFFSLSMLVDVYTKADKLLAIRLQSD